MEACPGVTRNMKSIGSAVLVLSILGAKTPEQVHAENQVSENEEDSFLIKAVAEEPEKSSKTNSLKSSKPKFVFSQISDKKGTGKINKQPITLAQTTSKLSVPDTHAESRTKQQSVTVELKKTETVASDSIEGRATKSSIDYEVRVNPLNETLPLASNPTVITTPPKHKSGFKKLHETKEFVQPQTEFRDTLLKLASELIINRVVNKPVI